MSHNFKHPSPIDPQERRENKQIAFMASLIKEQTALDVLLSGSAPDMRTAMLERLLPFLDFVPAELLIEDCPACGMRRGSAIAHECEIIAATK